MDYVLDESQRGVPLNDALTKAARAERLPPGIVELTARSINIAKTNVQRETADGFLAKFAYQDRCDPRVVLKNLALPAYEIAPVPTTPAKPEKSGQKKTAAAVAAPAEITKPAAWIDPSQYSAVDRYEIAMDVRRAVQAAREDHRLAKLAYRVVHGELVALAKRAGERAWLRACRIAKPTSDLYAQVETSAWGKRAAAKDLGSAYVLTAQDEQLRDILNKAAEREDAVWATYADLVNRAVHGHAITHRLTRSLPAPETSKLASGTTPLEDAERDWQKFSAATAATLGSLLGSRWADKASPDLTDPSYRIAELELNDPLHQQRLERIRLRASLQELLETDPVIGGADPSQVVSTFNQLAATTPNVVTKPMLLAPALRRALQGDMAVYDAQSLLEQEQRARPTHLQQRAG